jgi:hypothetical protein
MNLVGMERGGNLRNIDKKITRPDFLANVFFSDIFFRTLKKRENGRNLEKNREWVGQSFSI